MTETPPPQPSAPSKPSPRADVSSRPPASLGGADIYGGGIDRIARLQTIAAVVLGLALIAIPLYLWRRPRSESVPVTSAFDASAPRTDGGVAPVAVASAATATPPTPVVLLSEAKVMECHDPGSRRTRPEECDHLAPVEKAFAGAITSSGACMPAAAGGGTMVYVLDASFGRKRHPFELFVPKDGRALKNPHATAAAVNACAAAVKKGFDALTLDGVPHAHSRYKVAITATYPATTP